MTRKDAVELAIQLRKQGKTHEQIATELTAKGYLNTAGKPIDRTAVHRMLRVSGKVPVRFYRKKKASKSRGGGHVAAPKPQAKRGDEGLVTLVTLVKAVANNAAMKAEDKVALIQLVLS